MALAVWIRAAADDLAEIVDAIGGGKRPAGGRIDSVLRTEKIPPRESHSHLAVPGFDPNSPEPSEDPNAIKIIGPARPGEYEGVVKAIRIVLSQGIEIAEAFGADD